MSPDVATGWRAFFGDGPAAACAVILAIAVVALWVELRAVRRELKVANSTFIKDLKDAHAEQIRTAESVIPATKDLSAAVVAVRWMAERFTPRRKATPDEPLKSTP